MNCARMLAPAPIRELCSVAATIGGRSIIQMSEKRKL